MSVIERSEAYGCKARSCKGGAFVSLTSGARLLLALAKGSQQGLLMRECGGAK